MEGKYNVHYSRERERERERGRERERDNLELLLSNCTREGGGRGALFVFRFEGLDTACPGGDAAFDGGESTFVEIPQLEKM